MSTVIYGIDFYGAARPGRTFNLWHIMPPQLYKLNFLSDQTVHISDLHSYQSDTHIELRGGLEKVFDKRQK